MSWEAVNLRHVPDEPPEPPDYFGLVYRFRRHWFSGEPESLKTLVAYIVILVAVRRGEQVALIDFEMGQRDARNRLVELGATDDDFDKIDFYEPEGPPTQETIDAIASTCKLVVIDAAAGAFDVSGLDENRDGEKFHSLWVTPLWKYGLTVIVLDHVVKNAENRGMWAIGSQRKIGGSEVHLGFKASPKLERGGSGTVRITARKDRPGFHQRGEGNAGAIEFSSDPETHAITWNKIAATDGDVDFRPTVLMDRVSRYVELRPDGVSRSQVYRDVTGKRATLILAVDILVREGNLKDDGSRLVPAFPYRAGSPGSPSSQAVPGRFPDPGSSLVPTVPLLYEGNREPGNYARNDDEQTDLDYYESVASTMTDEGWFDDAGQPPSAGTEESS